MIRASGFGEQIAKQITERGRILDLRVQPRGSRSLLGSLYSAA